MIEGGRRKEEGGRKKDGNGLLSKPPPKSSPVAAPLLLRCRLLLRRRRHLQRQGLRRRPRRQERQRSGERQPKTRRSLFFSLSLSLSKGRSLVDMAGGGEGVHACMEGRLRSGGGGAEGAGAGGDVHGEPGGVPGAVQEPGGGVSGGRNGGGVGGPERVLRRCVDRVRPRRRAAPHRRRHLRRPGLLRLAVQRLQALLILHPPPHGGSPHSPYSPSQRHRPLFFRSPFDFYPSPAGDPPLRRRRKRHKTNDLSPSSSARSPTPP